MAKVVACCLSKHKFSLNQCKHRFTSSVQYMANQRARDSGLHVRFKPIKISADDVPNFWFFCQIHWCQYVNSYTAMYPQFKTVRGFVPPEFLW